MNKLIPYIISLLMASNTVHAVPGQFDGVDWELTNGYGYSDNYDRFRSFDDEIWWLLTAKDIGFTPNPDSSYVLVYDDKGTTKDNRTCDCLPEWDCDCYAYDDEFIGVFEIFE